MSNDTINYPEDSFENMIKFSEKHKFDMLNNNFIILSESIA